MDKSSRILIQGAGVAGLTCAIWLGRHGFRPVIVEKAPRIRASGSFLISLSGTSYRFAETLGLLPDLQARHCDIHASSYHNGRGETLLTLDYKDLFKGVDIIQITRDEIENVLYANAKNVAEYRFNTSAATINQTHSDTVEVEFTDGIQEEFDVVIGSDGLHSTIRKLAFDPADVVEHFLGLHVAAYQLEDVVGLKHKFEYHMEKNNYMVLYSTVDGKLGSVFVWQSLENSVPAEEDRWNILQNNYQDNSPLFHKVIDNFPNAGPMLMDSLLQIEVRKWHTGRVVLLGDAAHCMTLLSGNGASSALSDASYLSQALIAGTPQEAFRYHEQQMRPSISKLQRATRNAANWYVPRGIVRQSLRDYGMKLLPNSFFRRYFKAKYCTI